MYCMWYMWHMYYNIVTTCACIVCDTCTCDTCIIIIVTIILSCIVYDYMYLFNRGKLTRVSHMVARVQWGVQCQGQHLP